MLLFKIFSEIFSLKKFITGCVWIDKVEYKNACK
jgi:hypothetical protein